jgi:hypothetical protein
MIGQLREALSRRRDSYWELLATAAGDAESLQRTTIALSAESLASGPGMADAPSTVSARVEAFAAYSKTALAELAVQWPKPLAIGDNPRWIAAWTTALRHLKSLSVISVAEAAVPSIASEAAIVWPENTSNEVSWHAVVSQIQSHRLFYDDVRALAVRPLMESTLSTSEVLAAPWQALRLLRGRLGLQTVLRDAFIERARKTQRDNSFEAALAVELSEGSSPGFIDELRAEVIRTLASIDDARRLIPLGYVLVGDWRAP